LFGGVYRFRQRSKLFFIIAWESQIFIMPDSRKIRIFLRINKNKPKGQEIPQWNLFVALKDPEVLLERNNKAYEPRSSLGTYLHGLKTKKILFFAKANLKYKNIWE
jgi:hypothetical protein